MTTHRCFCRFDSALAFLDTSLMLGRSLARLAHGSFEGLSVSL